MMPYSYIIILREAIGSGSVETSLETILILIMAIRSFYNNFNIKHESAILINKISIHAN